VRQRWPSFLFLVDAHLHRWRGHALSRLGDSRAIDQLTSALNRLPPEFNRARAGLYVDSAFAHPAAGDREAALAYSQRARRLGMRIKSDRHLRRLKKLILPG
jgi:hypothetical protein